MSRSHSMRFTLKISFMTQLTPAAITTGKFKR
jgi:hypothetical protein